MLSPLILVVEWLCPYHRLYQRSKMVAKEKNVIIRKPDFSEIIYFYIPIIINGNRNS